MIGSVTLTLRGARTNALGQGSARSAMLLFDQNGKFVRVMSTNQTNIR
ncbi:hypothetical protein J2Y58_003514 [Sphingomonas sp. BE138]|nr:hypothetical protein [Sphingomonas sp. BE138]